MRKIGADRASTTTAVAAGPFAGVFWRVVLFVIVFSSLELGWQVLRGTSMERAVINDGTVRPAVFLINILTPGVHAQAVDSSLRAVGGSLNILSGCEGTEVLFLLVAAFAVAPLSWSARGWGLLLGTMLVFCLNQARILVLFYAYRANPSLFDQLHAIVAPIAVMFILSGYFYACLARAGRSAHSAT